MKKSRIIDILSNSHKLFSMGIVTKKWIYKSVQKNSYSGVCETVTRTEDITLLAHTRRFITLDGKSRMKKSRIIDILSNSHKLFSMGIVTKKWIYKSVQKNSYSGVCETVTRTEDITLLAHTRRFITLDGK